jgi:hypothetical protein
MEGLHDLDQADGVACGDLVALLYVYIAVWVGAAVESAWHLRLYGLVGQFSS